MTQKNIKWTPQQIRAIEEHARNVFVAASAGTGKTAVLSGSCVDAITTAVSRPDVWNILVLTFTDMAADEMRSRIAKQLTLNLQACKDRTLSRHLRHQLIGLGAADISTIHSFCKRLITEHFYELSLDPTFRVIDADAAKLLKAEVLEKTIDWAWNQNHLRDSLRNLLARRDLRTNDGFTSVIIEISDFLDCLVSRQSWLQQAQILADEAKPDAGELAQSQKQFIEEKLQDALSRIELALKIYNANSPDGKWTAKCKREYIGSIQQCIDRFKGGSWEFERPRVSKPDDVPQADLIGEIVSDALDSVRQLKDLAILNPEFLNKFARIAAGQTKALIELVRQFDVFYRQAKAAINCLDFADLEHYALRLLTNSDKWGQSPFTIEPSPTALKLREKYKYIFIDEYQDINSVQQTILDMLSSPDNVFAVGDPKQSIYQWRGANPEIFINNLKRTSTKPTTSDAGLRVDLNVNFRSAKSILDFVNLIFGRIMTASFTSIDYDQSAHLKPPSDNNVVSKTAPSVELHVLDKPQKNTTQDDAADDEQTDKNTPQFSGRQLQAALIAQRIKQIVGADTGKPEFFISDKSTGASRPVDYRDIVILMRSLAGRNDFVEVLRLSGVPVSCEATAGYFKATEIIDMLSLLKVLDNPRRDIELAAVLRSPLFCLTDTDLAKIRLFDKKNNHKSSFYDCLSCYCLSKNDPALADKLKTAMSTLDDWRTIARRGRIADLIWHIYRQTGLLSFVCALPDGPSRRANLLKLHDRAIQFENFASSSGVPSLTRFIVFLEKLLESGQDWAPAEPQSAAGNAVRVLSVHKSKGLEFPVVFLADLDNEFSRKDSRRDCLLDEQFTLGLQIIDPASNTRFDSLAYQVIEEHNRRKSLAEEMRILYVAMTRAIDRLILVGCADKKKCQRSLSSASFFDDGPIPHVILDSSNSHLDWILSALSRHPRLHQAFQTTAQIPPVDDNLFSVQSYDQPELIKLSSVIQNSKLSTQHSKLKTHTGARDLSLLKEALNWRYPFGDAPQLPAKRSVTRLTHRNDEFTKADYSLSLGRRPKAVLSTQQLDGRSIGSAVHLVISLLPLDKPPTTQSLTRLIHKLIADEAIAESVASHIDVGSIVNFFETDLAQMALDKNNKIYREWPFTFTIPASQWLELEQKTQHSTFKTENSTIIVQGIIDLLIETPAGLIVIDFKTDDVSADAITKRAELYRAQLDLYAQAAQAVTGQKIIAKWLYFLALDSGSLEL